ncbi:MAG TPA: aminopeptidase P family protein [Candidatus Faecousia intestinigallinarum]|nr:aminopeptidase P family protein [Candidatus Faecousia intestinigallinarum]
MKNLEKFQSLLGEKADGLLLTSRYSRYYGASFDIAEGVAVVSGKGCRYFTDSRYIESAEKGIQDFQVEMVGNGRSYYQLINQAIADFGITKLGYEENYLTMAEFLDYEKNLKAELVAMNREIHGFRAVKEDWELALMRKAQDITDAAFAQVVQRIRAGMTEKELCAELIYCLFRNGADGLSFDPIVVSGPNTSLPHGVPGDRKIQEGDFITMDFGVLYRGYCSDMTRTVALGYATEEMKTVYNTVLQAQLAGIAATRAGVTGRSIDEAARKVIADAGYGDYFGHGYGHSLGLEIHENPGCNHAGTVEMQENMVCSAEPGIYLPGKFGVRIEDVVIFKEGGCEDITNSPKELMIV